MMTDSETLAQMNGKHVCPPDAGPAWREAYEYGFDMSLIEDAFNKSPEERLDEHQQKLNFILEIEAARSRND